MSQEFSVLTFNVGNGLAKPSRVVKLIEEYAADIVALQELTHDQADAIEHHLHVNYPFRVLIPGGQSGKCILSQFPIRSTEQLNLYEDRPDLLAHLTIGQTEVSVISGHPRPPRLRSLKVRFDTLTLHQIKTLVSITRAHSPCILMGDFNMIENQAEYFYILGQGLRDAHRAVGSGAGHTLPTRLGYSTNFKFFQKVLHWMPLPPMARVDYVWYTDPLEAVSCDVGRDAGSDHLPVIVTMRI
jgi:endonuclease/exonuclease/phosphatase family metal-dependent hydrolase